MRLTSSVSPLPLRRGEDKGGGFSASRAYPCITLTLPLSLSKGEATMPRIVRCWSFLSIEQYFAVRSADTFGFTPSELRTLRALKTPAGVQKFLDDLP